MGRHAILWLGAILWCAGCTPLQNADRNLSDTSPAPAAEGKPHPTTKGPWSDLKQHTFANLPVPMATPAVSRDGKWLVYSAAADGYSGYQIFFKPADSISVTQLTFNDANNLYPQISPDGRHVVFASDKEGNWDLYVLAIQNPLTVVQLTLTRMHEVEPSWSPDGKSIVCSSQSPQGAKEIKIVDLSTRAVTLLGTGSNPVWSSTRGYPEGLIAFEMGQSARDRRLVLTTPDGTEVKDIVVADPEGCPEQPVWSPDGSWLGYTWTRTADGKKELWLARPDGGGKLKMMDDPELSDRAAWGGDRIFFLMKNDVRNVYSVKPYSLELLEE